MALRPLGWAALALSLAPALLALLAPGSALAGAECPSKCDCLRTGVGLLVNCSARNLTAFPAIHANISDEVLELDASQNALARLGGAAPRLPLLRALSLAGNRLEQLPARWLRRAPALLRLDLSANPLPLQGLGDALLAHAPHLQLLNLSRCPAIDSLDGAERVLASESLEVLDLSHCSIPGVTGSFLSALPSLRRLDLSYNPLHFLQGLNSSTLQELRLLHTGLDSLHPSALLDLRTLTELDVSGNRWFAFPERGVLSHTLTVLRARLCDLRPHNLKAFPNLRFASLQHNQIQGLWNTSFDNRLLTELDLSNNNIHRVHGDAFRGLPRLQRISLANNKISAIDPEVFAANEFLVEVNLSRNPLTDLGAIRCDALATLDVSQCNVNTLAGDSLRGMPALRVLDLSSNRLESIPDNMTADLLQWLDLSYCRLAAVGDAAFGGLPALQVLDLSGNRLTAPPRAEAFAANGRLRALRLRDNPWRCDCADAAFQRFAEFSLGVDQQEATHRATCAAPADKKGQTWLQACYDAWYPSLDAREPARRFGVALLAAVAVGGGALLLAAALHGAVKRRRKKQQRRQAEEVERRLEERERELRERLQRELGDDDALFLGPRSRAHRTPSQLTQPPSYEEALLLSRSQQDLLGAPPPPPSPPPPAPGPAPAAPAPAARHLDYEVEAEPPAPRKPRPAKPPRNSARWSSGDRLHNSQGSLQSGGDASGAGLSMSAGGAGSQRSSARYSVPNPAGIPDEMLSAIVEAMADTSAPPAASLNALLDVPAAPRPPASGSSSALSTPARTPRVRRPRSGCSSDASAEDSEGPAISPPRT